ncbi:MAG: hypothetical protein ACK46X_15600, partial [Candidatus Sericytochromatia bacterium]
IGGDRQIERLLRELPANQPLVVRNRLANVLPTVANLHDLGRMRAQHALRLTIAVPDNAVDERAIGLDQPVAGGFYEPLLSRLYGIRVEDAPTGGADTLLIALGYETGRDAEAQALATWLSAHPDVRVVFLLGQGLALHPALRPFAVGAWSAQTWDGLGAFAVPAVEEAVEEALPERIVVAGAPAAAVAYTAIGAADLFIRRETHAAGRPPADLRAVGGRVAVLRGASDLGALIPDMSWREAVRRHLEVDLGVASTAADPRFRVTAEAIAIDIV